MGRIIGISLAGSVFENMIQVYLRKYAPNLPAELVAVVINDANAIWTVVPDVREAPTPVSACAHVAQNLRDSVLVAYTKTVSDVYLIGVPLAFAGTLSALCIKNSRMQTKGEEQAAIQESKEAAAVAARAEGKTSEEVEKEVEAAAVAKQEEQAAAGIAMVNAEPEAAVDGGVDAQAVLAQQEGKSPV